MMGLQVRESLSLAIYDKSLNLSLSARQSASTGDIVNYMQLDTSRVESLAISLHTLWDGALQVWCGVVWCGVVVVVAM